MKKLIFLICLLSRLALAQNSDLIRYQIELYPESFDPAGNYGVYDLPIVMNTASTLMKADPQGKLILGLAKDIEVSADQRTYKISLRKDALWSDGKPITNGDVIRGLQTMPSAKVSEAANKIVIELETSNPMFLWALTQVSYGPRRIDSDFKPGSPFSGAYYVAEAKEGEQVLLKPNPYAGSPGRHSVLFKVIKDPKQAFQMFKQGELDIVTIFSPSDLDEMKSLGVSRIFPVATTTYLVFNTKKPPFNDQNLRRAISESIQKDNLVAIQPDLYSPAIGLIHPNIEGFTVLKPSGSTSKSAPVATELVYLEGPVRDKIVSSILSDVSKIGIQVTPVSKNYEDWSTSWSSESPPPLFLMGRTAQQNDAVVFLDSTPILNAFDNSEYSAYLEQLRLEPIGSKRNELTAKAHALLLDHAVVVPLFHNGRRYIVQKNIRGFHSDQFDHIDLSQIQKESK